MSVAWAVPGMVSRRVTGQTLIALLIILVGVILLGRSTDVYDVSWAFDFVPSLFVLAGVYVLIVSDFRNLVGSLLVIAVAGAWQLVTLDVVEREQVTQLWPLLIVMFGLSVLLGQYRARTHRRETADDHPTALAFFGGSEGRSTSKQFHGADFTAVFGGVEFDLRETEIGDRPAHVSATAVFGGVELRAPPEWNVEVDVLPLFGGAADERPRPTEGDDHEEVDLIVTGMALFGGVSVS